MSKAHIYTIIKVDCALKYMYCPSSIQHAENVSSKLQATGSLQEEASTLLWAKEFGISFSFLL